MPSRRRPPIARFTLLPLPAIVAGLLGLSIPAGRADTADTLHPVDLTADAPAAWQEQRFEGKTPNRFRRSADGLVIESDSAVSMLGRPVAVRLADTPFLRWDWRIDADVPATDLTRKGGDDRAIAVFVGFPWAPEQASLAERLARPLVEMARGADAPGRVLSYVWGGRSARGRLLRSPYLGESGALIVLRPAGSALGAWRSESVDLAADYRRAFGAPPPGQVSLVAISADSDDTASRARALIRGLRFAATAGGPSADGTDRE